MPASHLWCCFSGVASSYCLSSSVGSCSSSNYDSPGAFFLKSILGLASRLVLCRDLQYIKQKQLKLIINYFWTVTGHTALAIGRTACEKAELDGCARSHRGLARSVCPRAKTCCSHAGPVWFQSVKFESLVLSIVISEFIGAVVPPRHLLCFKCGAVKLEACSSANCIRYCVFGTSPLPEHCPWTDLLVLCIWVYLILPWTSHGATARIAKAELPNAGTSGFTILKNWAPSELSKNRALFSGVFYLCTSYVFYFVFPLHWTSF